MILKRFIYCLSLALPLVFTACSADSADVANPANGGDGSAQRLHCSATMRGASVSGETVLTDQAFKLLAWQRDSTRLDASTVVYFDSLWVGSKGDEGFYAADMVYYQGDALKSWTTKTEYYWPKDYVACDFYAVYPASAADISVTEREGSKRPVRYINYDNSTASQADLILAAMMCDKSTAAANALAAGGKGGMVPLQFHHALCRVGFQAKRTAATAPDPDFHVTVTSVTLCNVRQQGTFKFQDLPNTAGEAPVLGYWAASGTPTDITLYESTTGVSLATAGTVYDLTDSRNPHLLIPQTLTEWDLSTITPSTTGTYLKIGCQITIDGYNGNFADDGYVYVPFDAAWTPGNDYIYTLNFGTGYDHEGHLILQPVYITNTVTPWTAGESKTVDPAWL